MDQQDLPRPAAPADPQDELDVVAAYRAGRSLNEIEAQYRISATRLYKILNRYGVARRKRVALPRAGIPTPALLQTYERRIRDLLADHQAHREAMGLIEQELEHLKRMVQLYKHPARIPHE